MLSRKASEVDTYEKPISSRTLSGFDSASFFDESDRRDGDGRSQAGEGHPVEPDSVYADRGKEDDGEADSRREEGHRQGYLDLVEEEGCDSDGDEEDTREGDD